MRTVPALSVIRGRFLYDCLLVCYVRDDVLHMEYLDSTTPTPFT